MTQPINNTKANEMAAHELPKPKGKGAWYQTGVQIVSGGIAGATGILSATPLMYFKMHMQEKARNPQNPPKFQTNPVKWFAGGGGLAAWMFPQAAFNFYVTELMREKLSNGGKRELTPWEKLGCSSATGGLLTALVAPQELIYTQQKKAEGARLKMIELEKLDPKSVPSKSGMQITQEIWKKYGIKGFYRAAPETAAREMVSSSVLTYLAAEYPVLAPVVGALISQPLDSRKTNKQVDFAYKASLADSFKSKAFAGLAPRVGIYLIFMNVASRVKNQTEKMLLPEKTQGKTEKA